MQKTSNRDRRSGPPRRARPAFSLVELLIVIAVMAITAGVLIPRLQPSVHDQLGAAAEVVVADLAFARSLAVANDSVYCISFEPNENRYRLWHSGSNTFLDTLPTSPFQDSASTADQHVTDLDDLPHLGPPAQLLAVRKLMPAAQAVLDVEFGPLGETSRTEPTRIWLACGGGDGRLYVSIDIDPVTGLATIGSIQATPPSVVPVGT